MAAPGNTVRLAGRTSEALRPGVSAILTHSKSDVLERSWRISFAGPVLSTIELSEGHEASNAGGRRLIPVTPAREKGLHRCLAIYPSLDRANLRARPGLGPTSGHARPS